MTVVEIFMKAQNEHIPVKITLEDGIILDGVHVSDCMSYDDIELDVPMDIIHACKAKGRERVCIIDWDEIKSVELLEA